MRELVGVPNGRPAMHARTRTYVYVHARTYIYSTYTCLRGLSSGCTTARPWINHGYGRPSWLTWSKGDFKPHQLLMGCIVQLLACATACTHTFCPSHWEWFRSLHNTYTQHALHANTLIMHAHNLAQDAHIVMRVHKMCGCINTHSKHSTCVDCRTFRMYYTYIEVERKNAMRWARIWSDLIKCIHVMR